MFQETYREKKILLTGHTGFKGAWLITWLLELGAEVVGYSLEPSTHPNLFSINSLEKMVHHYIGDVRDKERLSSVFMKESPELVIHFAAQSLVLTSYKNPVETFEVNAQGTVNVLDASLHCPETVAVLVITTDKVYENREWCWGYRENDRLGGHDPYSASKAMAELAVDCYRKSYGTDSGLVIASARAGNVIGGGDFSENRLLPDAMKALMKGETIHVRNPKSIRPWMHVLDPLFGYLLLGQKMMTEGSRFAEAWNFAPRDMQGANCKQIVERAIGCWGKGDWVDASSANSCKETSCLRLNGDKAAQQLGWIPSYDWMKAVDVTVDWYKAYHEGRDMYNFTLEQIENYSISTVSIRRPDLMRL